MTAERDKLDELLRSAHARDDGDALAELYTLAANLSEDAGDIDAACFYLTHAFVFGLQCGSDVTLDLQMRLCEYGREARPEGQGAMALRPLRGSCCDIRLAGQILD